ncbi:hypothetical protein Tco_0108484, partial [Tanacetum coccineum]
GGEGSSATRDKQYEFKDISATNSNATQYSLCSDTDEAKDYETDDSDDSDDSDMDLYDDEPKEDDDAVGFRVFMYNKSTELLKSTYLSPTVTTSSLEYIHNLLNEPPVNELTDFMSHTMYIDDHTTSVVANLEGNPENSLQAKAKMFMQKAKKNMRKINFKKLVAQKFKEYDQKLEALTSVNVSEAINKVVQAKVLTEMKKLLLTHVPKVLANYVKPRLNNYVLEVIK